MMNELSYIMVVPPFNLERTNLSRQNWTGWWYRFRGGIDTTINTKIG